MAPIQHPNESVRFTVDGRPLSVDDKHQTAASILRLSGLSPADYDLARIRKEPGDPQAFRDEQMVVIKNGDAFVTVRQSAQVA